MGGCLINRVKKKRQESLSIRLEGDGPTNKKKNKKKKKKKQWDGPQDNPRGTQTKPRSISVLGGENTAENYERNQDRWALTQMAGEGVLFSGKNPGQKAAAVRKNAYCGYSGAGP